MKTLLFNIIVLFFLMNSSYSQWVQQNVPADIDMILSIDFANSSRGAAGGWEWGFIGKAVYTTNSGINWFMAQVPDSSRSLVRVQLLNEYTGYIAGAYNVYIKDRIKNIMRTEQSVQYRNALLLVRKYFELVGITGERGLYKGLFLKTTNGGQNWITHGSLPSNVYYLLGMRFININTGFVSASLNYSGGVQGAILKTTNGGLNWNSLVTVDSVDFNNVFTIDGNMLFVTGWKRYQGMSNRGIILKSSNGGINWTIQNFTAAASFSDVHFSNQTTGFVSGWDGDGHGVIYKTTNGGLNWANLNILNVPSSYNAIEFFTGTGKGFAAGLKLTPVLGLDSLLITRTTNYGANWINHTIPDSSNILYSTSIVDLNTWYVCGGASIAIIYKTTTGGEPIGIESVTNEIPMVFKLHQNYPNPFNPATRIKFAISLSRGVDAARLRNGQEGGRGVLVRLIVFDILGREVAMLVDEQLKPGSYEVMWDASTYPSGIYFYKLVWDSYIETRKMVLIK